MEPYDDTCEKLVEFLGINQLRPRLTIKTYEKIGDGSMCEGVYKGQAKDTRRKYAVKVFRINPDIVTCAKNGQNALLDDAAGKSIKDAVKEFKEISKFQQENLVKYFYIDTQLDGRRQQYQLHIAMERCYADCTAYLENAVSGLHFLHQHKIVHRDLRPENLLFAETNRKTLKIADYSAVVKLDGSLTQSGEVTTTGGPPWAYQAPEVANKKFGNPGRRSDVWSLACVLIFMLQGKDPFFQYRSRHVILAKSSADIRRALLDGHAPYIDGDFQRKKVHGNEEAFLHSAKDFLRLCLIARSTERADMNKMSKHMLLKSTAPAAARSCNIL
ncbi:mitogen-activated protein kinase kinase kinase 4-like isoform X2 [Paramacrobiotus metropolitanus]|uniref:mitogen-activated protein kinase kinase kinase 4-like isoform X2 n=1 Tax=Paramacrobiotus metropolitanus TaxID=2943436 RepID=UPI0024463F16|nr:mitogen-activated protein kinase kinase kinase 4-like isoform X2 [Paramacrobiotus metropolitanus]